MRALGFSIVEHLVDAGLEVGRSNPSTRAVVHHLATLQENAPGRSRAENPP